MVTRHLMKIGCLRAAIEGAVLADPIIARSGEATSGREV